MTLTFRNDTPDDFLTILREVGQWLTDSGQELWEMRTLTPENLFDDYTIGNCYVLYVDGIPAATFILQWRDPIYWDDILPNTSGFIHKLAIRRAFGGRNLFQPILNFCQAECRSRRINELRLDTEATRPKLMQFYERYGFEPVRRRMVHEFGQTFDCQFYVMRF